MVTRAEAWCSPTVMYHGFIDLICNLILSAPQNFKTYLEKSSLLIRPICVKRRAQRFSTDAGSAGIEPYVFPTA